MTTTHAPAAPDLDLLPTDIEGDLRSTLRELLADRCSQKAVTALYDGDRAVVESLWRAFAGELGLASLLIPEELGGAGASALEAATVLEELGQACAPLPFLTSSVIATTVLLGCDDDAARTALEQLAAGERTAALVVPLSTGPEGDLAAVHAEAGEAGTARLTGSVRSVAGAIEADLLVVPAQRDGGLALVLVERDAVGIESVSSLDMGRQIADVTLDGAEGRPLQVGGSGAEALVRHALLVGAGLLASEQVGVAQWCLQGTVDYLKVRRQFGRIVGGFQALKHRLADLYAAVESASAAVRYAAATIAADADVPIAARVAAAHAGDVAVHAAEEAVQLHGGIGMTWEHPTHLYLKRAKADQLALGTPSAHRDALGALIGV